jgi:hypothetical protein
MTKILKEMTNEELLSSWEKGCFWLKGKLQAEEKNKAEDGSTYSKTLFLAGLKRIEEIEDELIKRGVSYGH